MNRLLKILIITMVAVTALAGIITVIKNTIDPKGTVVLTGSFDPTTTYVYINNTRITTKDLGVRKFAYNGKTGTFPVLVTGPGIKTVKTTLSVKPLFGGKDTIAILPSDDAITTATKILDLNPGATITSAQLFDQGWIGVSVDDPASSYTTTIALKYNYEKGSWDIVDSDGSFDTSSGAFKGAPKDLITFLTDTAGD